MTTISSPVLDRAGIAVYSSQLSTAAGLIAVVLLMVLLTIKEVVRASDRHRGLERIAALNIAIFPLLGVFGLVVGIRLAKLLHLF